jgi:hypothetical protein
MIRYTSTADAVTDLKELHKQIERKYNVKIRRYRLDNEFNKGEFKAWLISKGVTLEPIVPYAHHQIGVSERLNRTIREGAAAIIAHNSLSGTLKRIIVENADVSLRATTLPASLWPEAVQYAVWLKNRTPTRARKGKTPWERVEGVLPDFTRERIWGSRVYIRRTEEQLRARVSNRPRGTSQPQGTKLHDQRAWLGYFVGCENESTYRVYDPEDHTVKLAVYAQVDDGEGLDDDQQRDDLNTALPHTDQPQEHLPEHDSSDPSEDSEVEELPQHVVNASAWLSSQDAEDAPMDQQSSYWSSSAPDPIPASAQTPNRARENDESDEEQNHSEPDPDHASDGNPPTVPNDRNWPLPDKPADNEEWVWTPARFLYARQEYLKKRKPAEIASELGCTRSALHKKMSSGIGTGHEFSTRAKMSEDEAKWVDSTYGASQQLRDPTINLDLDISQIEKWTKPQKPTQQEKFEWTADRFVWMRQEKAKGRDLQDIADDLGCEIKRIKSVNVSGITKTGPGSLRSKLTKAQIEYVELTANLAVRPTITADTKRKAIEQMRLGRSNGEIKDILNMTYGSIQWLRDNARRADPTIPLSSNTQAYKCRRCFGAKTHCDSYDGTKACTRCTSLGRDCFHTSEDGIVEKVYLAKGPNSIFTNLPKFDPETNECTACTRKKRTCAQSTATTPCWRCVTQSDSFSPICAIPQSETVIHQIKHRYFSYNDKQGVFRNPDIPDHALDAKYRRAEHDESELNSDEDEEVVDDDTTTKSPHQRNGRGGRRLYRSDSEDEEEVPQFDKTAVQSKLSRFANMNAVVMTTVTAPINLASLPVPHTLKEARLTKEWPQWDQAVRDEYKSLQDTNTFEVVRLPPGRKALTCRWVLARKLAADLEITRYKARLVARGCQQVQGFDFTETFAGVVKASSIRLLFAIAAALGWKMHQMDFKTAYLNAHLKEEVYMFAPEGFPLPKGFVLLLRRALYGLKQSGREWYTMLKEWLLNNGWISSQFDECVFINTKSIMVMMIYVDDIIIMGPQDEIIVAFKSSLNHDFKVTDEGEASFFLGMQIEKTGQGLKIHQDSYVQQMFTKYNLIDIRPTKAPLDVLKKLQTNPNHTASDSFRHEYMSKIGSLNYLASKTRPDISYAISLLSRFSKNPTQEHMDGVTHVFSYIAGTPDFGLKLNADNDLQLRGYVDADWGMCKDTYRSQTGYIYTLGGSPISWASQRQQSVGTSSTHAEYVAASDASKEAVWTRGFLNELSVLDSRLQQGPVPLFIDNMSAIKLTKNPEFHARTRHIDIRHHYIRELVTNHTITTEWIPGAENPADMLTKALHGPHLQKLRLASGVDGSSSATLAASAAIAADAEGENTREAFESGGVL